MKDSSGGWAPGTTTMGQKLGQQASTTLNDIFGSHLSWGQPSAEAPPPAPAPAATPAAKPDPGSPDLDPPVKTFAGPPAPALQNAASPQPRQAQPQTLHHIFSGPMGKPPSVPAPRQETPFGLPLVPGLTAADVNNVPATPNTGDYYITPGSPADTGSTVPSGQQLEPLTPSDSTQQLGIPASTAADIMQQHNAGKPWDMNSWLDSVQSHIADTAGNLVNGGRDALLGVNNYLNTANAQGIHPWSYMKQGLAELANAGGAHLDPDAIFKATEEQYSTPQQLALKNEMDRREMENREAATGIAAGKLGLEQQMQNSVLGLTPPNPNSQFQQTLRMEMKKSTDAMQMARDRNANELDMSKIRATAELAASSATVRANASVEAARIRAAAKDGDPTAKALMNYGSHDWTSDAYNKPAGQLMMGQAKLDLDRMGLWQDKANAAAPNLYSLIKSGMYKDDKVNGITPEELPRLTAIMQAQAAKKPQQLSQQDAKLLSHWTNILNRTVLSGITASTKYNGKPSTGFNPQQ